MYCPKCATPLSDDQKFCRTCGLNLQDVSRVLASEHLVDRSDEPKSRTEERLESRKAVFERRGIIAVISALLIGCLIPIIVGINNYYPGLTPLIPILAGVAGILLFSGAILLIYGNGLPKEQPGRDSSRPPNLPQSIRTNKLPSEDRPENFLSVTEETTDLLETAKAKGETHFVGKKDE